MISLPCSVILRGAKNYEFFCTYLFSKTSNIAGVSIRLQSPAVRLILYMWLKLEFSNSNSSHPHFQKEVD